ncbi:MAG: Endonuclease [Myxococcaceae bacterium]|nr:Endonuclease [Myxococcaceae bacterium]
MTALADKARRIEAVLDALHPSPAIPLDHVDPYTLLVAVALSAQTTDKKVNQVTPALFARAPTPAAMRALSVEEIHGFIREVNFAPAKAKALRRAAEMLCDEHGGVVPADFDALVALPGVGNKTASVVMGQAFGAETFPVDTHILRLAHRWGLSKGRTPDQVSADLQRVFARPSWNKVHLQIIYFGRSHCPALRHDLAACPICSWAASKARIAAEARAAAPKKRRRATPA